MTAADDPDAFTRATIGRLQLLIPVVEVIADVPGDSTTRIPLHGCEIAAVVAGEEVFPLLQADEDLNLRAAENNGRGRCLCLRHGDMRLALVCDATTRVAQTDLVFHDLPVCMAGADTPVSGLAIADGAVCCVTAGSRLVRSLAAAQG